MSAEDFWRDGPACDGDENMLVAELAQQYRHVLSADPEAAEYVEWLYEAFRARLVLDLLATPPLWVRKLVREAVLDALRTPRYPSERART